jgi:hypothetical protein
MTECDDSSSESMQCVTRFPAAAACSWPDSPADDFGVVLFHCGSSSLYCNSHLRAFQRSLGGVTGGKPITNCRCQIVRCPAFRR